jgi:hypothetical protein
MDGSHKDAVKQKWKRNLCQDRKGMTQCFLKVKSHEIFFFVPESFVFFGGIFENALVTSSSPNSFQ